MNLTQKLLLICRISFLVAGMIFLGLTIWCDYGNWTLIAALGCTALGNLLCFFHAPRKQDDPPKF